MNVRGVAMILALSAAAASDAFGRTPQREPTISIRVASAR